ncbi:hypothetical protein T4B_482 [Trichinella pseudospiralis]|uniref:Uncharacterized protein n=1 Tax=Trichinella pseudospiralis TaxID=6337 RepID=A0A0V1GRJ6_TRIPS|nr:hypothetical protein T4A_95 [Trichinella pseudospiralis]KRZ00738.1 hypothetical protein T4B_482 [Trichinella pseudospiralis]
MENEEQRVRRGLWLLLFHRPRASFPALLFAAIVQAGFGAGRNNNFERSAASTTFDLFAKYAEATVRGCLLPGSRQPDRETRAS